MMANPGIANPNGSADRDCAETRVSASMCETELATRLVAPQDQWHPIGSLESFTRNARDYLAELQGKR